MGYNKTMKKSCFFLILFFVLVGCAHVMPEEILERVDNTVTPEILFRDPEAHKGSIVLLGGMIVSSRNANEGTYLEVLQKPLDRRGRPKDVDESAGRFIVLYNGYLDSAIYSQGKSVSVVGEVIGSENRPLGETEYRYILLKSIELKLVDASNRMPVRFSIGVGATF